MPQIMCPNCGTTINLENRREMDFELIKNAAKKGPRTFTELLHITKLSRKTLSLRLKDLCDTSILVKNDKAYHINGGLQLEHGESMMKRFDRAVHDKKIKTGLFLIALLLFSSASGYVMATFLMPKDTHQEPTILGAFSRALQINNVQDLCAWQVAVTFGHNEIKILEVTSGNFLGNDVPFFINATDVPYGLLVGGCVLGNVSGRYGNTILATIVFGYFVSEYQEPKIAFNEKTFLLDSNDSTIPIETSTLALSPITK